MHRIGWRRRLVGVILLLVWMLLVGCILYSDAAPWVVASLVGLLTIAYWLWQRAFLPPIPEAERPPRYAGPQPGGISIGT